MLKIDTANYQGYIWYSDANTPTIIDGEYELALDDSANPFVNEGMLYCADSSVSVSVKYIDGKYVVTRHKVEEDDFNRSDVDICEYVPHRLPGVARLMFLQYWTPAADDMCCGMEVLTPGRKVFIGFKK